MHRKALLLCALALLAACRKKKPEPERFFPVTVFALREFQPANRTALTGSAEPYRQEDVGFEVGGRLLGTRDVGSEVAGSAYGEDGAIVQAGAIIARLDDTRYGLTVEGLRARIASREQALKAQRVEVDVARSNVKRDEAQLSKKKFDVESARKAVEVAEANRRLAEQNLRREKQLLARGAGTQQEVDNSQRTLEASTANKQQADADLEGAQASFDSQAAVVESAKANIELKKAQVGATQARVKELGHDLSGAERDLEDCTLRAPFNGRVTRVLVSRGAVVRAGQPVLTLTLMDPIKIAVAVSADVDRRVAWGDPVTIRPQDPAQPDAKIDLTARVYEKGEVADPATRTFRVDLMVRNERIQLAHQDPDNPLPVVELLLPVLDRYKGEGGTLYVPIQAILRKAGKAYVLKVDDARREDRGVSGRYVPEKTEVQLGDQYMGLSSWTFRSIAKADLKVTDFVVPNPRPEHVKGFLVGRYMWLIRPGDLIPVVLPLLTGPPGFYVPVDAVRAINDQTYVFAIENGRARRIEVTPHESQGDARRITGEIKAGMQVAVKGVHLLDDGDKVAVVGKESR